MKMSSTQQCEDILSMKCDDKLECIYGLEIHYEH
jgi:hypothetical protein